MLPLLELSAGSMRDSRAGPSGIETGLESIPARGLYKIGHFTFCADGPHPGHRAVYAVAKNRSPGLRSGAGPDQDRDNRSRKSLVRDPGQKQSCQKRWYDQGRNKPAESIAGSRCCF
jgi:hypothetical protein